MADNKEKWLYKIVIPSSAEHKVLGATTAVLTDRDKILAEINKNISNLTKEQLEYLKSLLYLETSVFTNDSLNTTLVNDQLFYYASRYNLYEGLLKTLRQIEDINKDNVYLTIGVPKRTWLEVVAYTESHITAIKLLEITMGLYGQDSTEKTNINIYDSNGYTKEIEEQLKENYIHQGKTQEQINFWLNDHRQKREITRIISNEILKYWKLSDFQQGMSYDEKILGKSLSWANVYKEDLYD